MEKPPRVRRTKTPSIREIEKMVFMLRHKFDCSANIEYNCWDHSNGIRYAEYHIAVCIDEDAANWIWISKLSWTELQDEYFKLMEQK